MNHPLKHSILACALMQAFAVSAQTAAQTAAQTTAQADAGQPVNEVVVTGNRFIALDRASVGGFGEASLFETPASIISIGRTQMQDLSIRSTTEAVRFDASVSDAYNAVGYAEQFSIRGFTLDNNYSYRKDGFAIPGDTQIPIENKERIEILKGLAGLTAGIAAPGGIVNYVTKRPTDKPLRSATVEVSERGTLYGSADIGGRFEDRRFGYRINAAADLHPYVRGANGDRQFVSGAFDWQITPDALLQLDMDYQRKSQITAPGYQLIRGEVLPTNVSAKTLLNDQPWTRPVETRDTNLGLRFEVKLAPGWTATASANKHWFKRDDYTAFPYGCSNEGDGYYPGYCSNGDYDVYDYQSVGERKSPWGVQAMVQGKFATGTLRHALTVGASYNERHDSFGDYVYELVGSSNIWTPRVTPQADPSKFSPGPVSERRSDQESALFAQDIVTLGQGFTLHGGLRHVQIKRSEFDEDIGDKGDYVHADNSFTLPSVALVYRINRDWNAYGSFSHGLQHGGIAPMMTSNQYQVLPPARSRQAEFGLKGALSNGLNLSAALFQIRQGLEYEDPFQTFTVIVDGEPKELHPFVRGGRETHRGLEVSADGRTGAFDYGVSLMALNTRQDGTGQAGIDGKRVTDVPAFKSTAWLQYAVPAVPGLKVDGIWQYAGKKAFDVQNTVFVPDYHVFGAGASYGLKLGATQVTVRARVDNLFDKFYWRDVTPSLGGYLLAGAPRTFRLSAQFDL